MNKDNANYTPGAALSRTLSDLALALVLTDKSAAHISSQTGVGVDAINRLIAAYYGIDTKRQAYYPSSKTIERLSDYVGLRVALVEEKQRI